MPDREDRIEKLENNLNDVETIIGFNHVDQLKRTTPILEQLSELKVVRKQIDGEQTTKLIKLETEIKELKEQIKKLNAQADKNAIRSYNNREVLRDFQRIAEASIDFKTFSALSKTLKDKLGGEKPVHETLEMKGSKKANLGMKVIESDSKPLSECPICHDSGKLNDGGSIVGCYKCGRDWRTDSKPPSIPIIPSTNWKESVLAFHKELRKSPSEQFSIKEMEKGIIDLEKRIIEKEPTDLEGNIIKEFNRNKELEYILMKKGDLINLEKKKANMYKIGESITFHKKDWDKFYNKYITENQ